MMMAVTRAMTALSMAMLVGLGGQALAQESSLVFKHKLSSGSVGEAANATGFGDLPPPCEKSLSVGSICSGDNDEELLVVDDIMIRSAASKRADPDGGFLYSGEGGDESFKIAPGDSYAPEDLEKTYSFRELYTGKVTTMDNLFADASTFNQDVGGWDVSNVTNMSYMFSNSYDFNQDIGNWDVSRVTDMKSMFEYAIDFNQDIGGWDTSNVTHMTAMFDSARAFNQDLSGWCVTNITEYPVDVRGYPSFDQGANSWTGGDATRPQWGSCP